MCKQYNWLSKVLGPISITYASGEHDANKPYIVLLTKVVLVMATTSALGMLRGASLAFNAFLRI
jgi:hypothetical protein